MEFSAPSSGGEGVSAADVDGHIIVVEPLEYVTSITTSYGEKDAVRCRVHDLSTQTTHEDCLWFPMALVGQLKGLIGQRVLGQMGRGEAKAGQSAPWKITPLNDNADAVTAATAYLTQQTANSFVHQTPLSQGGQDVPENRVAAPSALDGALANLAGITK